MGKTIYNLAFDFGASSGRLIMSTFSDGKIEIEELHRFANDPVRVGKGFYWDTFRLLHEMKQGLKKAVKKNVPFESIGIDTWGVDYGLLDKDDNLIGNPVNYRDERTIGVQEKMDKLVPLSELYRKTGIQFCDFNTIFQMLMDKETRPVAYEQAERLLFMPDLLGYFLTGVKYNEYTIASTGQILDAATRKIDKEILDKAGIRSDLFGELVQPGTVVGTLRSEIVEEVGGLEGVKLVAVGSHDTASAVVATPFADPDAAFLSCGTWSLLGMELDEPITNEAAFAANITNEGGAEGKIRFLKNINGLWIMQNLRKNWCQFEAEVGFPDIIREAKNAKNKNFAINPNDPRFTAPYNMMKEIIAYCEETGQGTPNGLGELAMAIYNGLTGEYKTVIEELEQVTGKTIPCINMVGGGIQDKLLCQLTADKTGKKVIAGPTEGSVLGNLLMQLKAAGEVADLTEARDVIRRSFETEEFLPTV